MDLFTMSQKRSYNCDIFKATVNSNIRKIQLKNFRTFNILLL